MSVLKQFEHLKIQLEAIESATNKFAEESCIGKGGFGKVYKGDLLHLNGRTTVAIKRLDRSFGQRDSEFWKEVIMLSVYSHENIVSLLGFCDEKDEKILVYEYSSRGSLDLHLDNKDLTWVRRLTICIGAARGLAYLHNPAGTQQRVLHRDIKSSNILLDENWNARISDLGLSKFGPANQNYTFLITNNRAGTIGYCDPQYVESGILTKESDVYSFGVVLFEVLCGRLCFRSNDKTQCFTQVARKHYKQKSLNEFIWGNIKDQIHPTSLEVFAAIAFQCLKNDSRKRPLMESVVSELETALEYQANMDRFVDQGSLDDNVYGDMDSRDAISQSMDVRKQSTTTFEEVNSVRASVSKVVCCHFSSDGKLLASGGHDKKFMIVMQIVLWHTDSLKPKATLEEHSSLITDVRFSPSRPRLATSSFDKTIRIWDPDNPIYSIRTFVGHSTPVMSLDFHPNEENLICSCDMDGEIRYWDIRNGTCVRVFKGATAQVRFQPRQGRYIAAAAGNIVLILDAKTHVFRHLLQGHAKPIQSVCWDPQGEYLACVSADSVRVWSLMAGNEGECIHDLSCNGNKFHSCVFHLSYPTLLVIGCYQSLELWNMPENKYMILSAHEGLIAGLALSTVTGLVASASHDKIVKLWK
ncbi:hypothetical protein LXL04_015587 [Taraxacum kok-saghyz]